MGSQKTLHSREGETIEDLQGQLTTAWKDIPVKNIRAAISGWLRRLKIVQDVEGEHF